MSATTLDQQQAISTDYNQSQAVHTLADMLYRGDIPTQTAPGQAMRVSFHVPDAEDVTEFAGRMGIEYTNTTTAAGTYHTSATLWLGEGSHEHDTDAYNFALGVTVVNVRDIA